ncbi:helix-turn-helix domain-containing protein [Nonomuraea sp. NPDC050663]|uniref:PucR family transcriptional regulator n=1 Tax=Nonomuraea sp. NPDC050663 TaxID=3364370 RepID=UPI0037A956C8
MNGPGPAALTARLLARVDELAIELARRVRAAEIELTVVPEDDVATVCAEQLRVSLAHLGGGAASPTDVAKANARRRALRGIPLAALLHSYRIGTQFLWERIAAETTPAEHAVLIESAGELWLGLDLLSETIREAYREVEAERELRDRLDRDRLFDALLGTDPARIREAADALGLPQRGRFHVIATDATADLPPAAVQRHLPTERLAVLAMPAPAPGGHPSGQPGRLPDGSRGGRPGGAPESSLGGPPGSPLAGPPSSFPPLAGGRFGVSPAYHQLSQTAAALRLARLALAAVPPGAEAVCHYGDRPIATLIAGSPETADDLARRVLGPLLDLPRDERDTLLSTARAWFDAAGSTPAAATALFCHRNTVRYRLGKLQELTGRSVDHPVQAAELLLALETITLLEYPKGV